MKLLLETNALVAALVARGTCSDLLEHSRPPARVLERVGIQQEGILRQDATRLFLRFNRLTLTIHTP